MKLNEKLTSWDPEYTSKWRFSHKTVFNSVAFNSVIYLLLLTQPSLPTYIQFPTQYFFIFCKVCILRLSILFSETVVWLHSYMNWAFYHSDSPAAKGPLRSIFEFASGGHGGLPRVRHALIPKLQGRSNFTLAPDTLSLCLPQSRTFSVCMCMHVYTSMHALVHV